MLELAVFWHIFATYFTITRHFRQYKLSQNKQSHSQTKRRYPCSKDLKQTFSSIRYWSVTISTRRTKWFHQPTLGTTPFPPYTALLRKFNNYHTKLGKLQATTVWNWRASTTPTIATKQWYGYTATQVMLSANRPFQACFTARWALTCLSHIFAHTAQAKANTYLLEHWSLWICNVG